MADINLKEIYFKLLINYTDEKTINIFWNEISKKYNSSKRFYHNLNHITELIDLSIEYNSSIYDVEILQLSIFYHDVIYYAIKKDNELKSAVFCKKHLNKINYPKEKIEKCYEYILATKSHKSNNENDLNFLLDFDLAILGSQWADYEKYLNQIRKEYSIFPDIIYNNGRKKVLKHFLKQERIYKTDEFFSNFENVARENLSKELKQLINK